MDKYEFNIKVEQIKKLVNKGDYETAMKIADTIDWRRVRNANLLSMIASIYEKNEEYQEAKDILLIAFERAPIGKRLLYKLTQLALKSGNVQEAESYYREFCELADDDARQDILRYLILKAKGAPLEQLIHSLESYTSTELDEKWLYELAVLYRQADMEEECVKTCDKIMLMFGLGQYVDKAMELKLQYAPLTRYQMDLVENRDKYEEKLKQVEKNSVYAAPQPAEEYEEAKDPALQQTLEAEKEALEKHVEIEDEEDDPVRSRIQPQPIPVRVPAGAVPVPAPATVAAAATAPAAAVAATAAVVTAPVAAATAGADHAAEAATTTATAAGATAAVAAAAVGTGVTVTEAAIPQGAALAASMKEAEMEANLAEEMSKISLDEVAKEPAQEQTRIFGAAKAKTENVSDKTRILDDIRRVQAARAEEKASAAPAETKTEHVLRHLMVEDRSGENGIKTAVEVLREMHALTGVKRPAVKITGEKLNQKGISDSAEKLAGRDLVIENAGDLTDDMLDELDQLLTEDQTGMVAILVDSPRQLEGIRKAAPALAAKFKRITSLKDAGDFLAAFDESPAVQAAVKGQPEAKAEKAARKQAVKEAEPDVKPENAADEADYEADDEADYAEDDEADYEEASEEETVTADPEPMDETVMDIDEFAQYCCHYASQIDCSITGKSMLALYERIEIMEEDNIALTKSAAEDLIEEAADKAEKPSFGKRITGLFSSKYDKEGLLILKEEHFI